ncbi:sigma 54-interacting transcriptional regulator [Candidatus Halobeggiatoa sp. HSG11]|nr:sigma 54-interacting transcriptional regulator [Candidatus Halobeggiatoa sp. HSG11]
MPKKAIQEPIVTEIRSLRILLVDDDSLILTMLTAWLEDTGYEVKSVENGSDAVSMLPDFKPNLVITDLCMEEMDGIALLKEVQKYNSILPVIILSGNADIPDAVRATHQGVFEFLTKPVDPDKLFHYVRLALARVGAATNIDFAPKIIHQSVIMANLLKQAQRVAKTRSSVFIGGATGTGKELLANAIHNASPRCDKVFMEVNCGALSEQLLESELFGHEKGAFTGAVRKNLGMFQAANGGTLFLDEVGDMSPNLQVKLLRVLQDGKVRPVGAVNSVEVDVRIISATHHNLEAATKRGEFRDDLFYRLNVIPLYMPSLSERKEDIPLLIGHFLGIQAEKEELEETPRFAPEALEYMMSLPWYGNVRQLENVIEQCSVLSISPIIPVSLVKEALRESENNLQTLAEARKEFDQYYLNRILNMVNGDIKHAANIAGYKMEKFEKLLKQFNIDSTNFRRCYDKDTAGDDIHII